MSIPIDQIVQILLVICGALLSFLVHQAVAELKGVKEEFKSLRESVAELNVNVAVVVKRVDIHEQEISQIKGRIWAE